MMRVLAWVTFGAGIATLAAAAIALTSEFASTAIPADAVHAQECVSEALPVQAPAASPAAAPAPARLPSTGNAGLLPPSNAPLALQECPTPPAVAPATAVPPTPVATVPAPTATAAVAAPTPTAAGGELPGGGVDSGGFELPPGSIGY
jgi:hypothetical protein